MALSRIGDNIYTDGYGFFKVVEEEDGTLWMRTFQPLGGSTMDERGTFWEWIAWKPLEDGSEPGLYGPNQDSYVWASTQELAERKVAVYLVAEELATSEDIADWEIRVKPW